jgi:hypothetical protein
MEHGIPPSANKPLLPHKGIINSITDRFKEKVAVAPRKKKSPGGHPGLE